MEFTFINEDAINVVVIDNVYNDKQLKSIWKELEFMTDEDKLRDPHQTGTATAPHKGRLIPLKNNKGIFLDPVYRSYEYSPIIKNAIEIIRSEDFINKISGFNPLFKIIQNCNAVSTLLSYYETSDYYKPHTDHGVFTMLSHYFKEPKKFTGGNLTLISDTKKVEIEIRNNRSILFPSVTMHSVDMIGMTGDYQAFGGDGRYCISHFLATGEPPAPPSTENKS